MAKILLGANIAGISGKQGGTVYSKNRFGWYQRSKGAIVNTNTTKQNIVKENFRLGSTAWKALTSADRIAWETFALSYTYINSFGESKKLTGFQLFTGGRARQAYLGLAQTDVPGVAIPPSSPSINIDNFELTVDEILINTLGAVAWTIPPGFTAIVYASKPMAQSNGYSTAKKYCRYIATIAGGGDDVTTGSDIRPQYISTPFPPPVIQELVWFRVEVIHDASGIISNTQTFSGVVV